ncbi:MAG: hypothetical protein ACOZDD_17890 [Bacteroidota bacterium]
MDWTVNPVVDEYTIEAAFTVKTCQDACNVKVQGGLIAKDLNVIRKES